MKIGLTNPVKEQAENMILITRTKASQAGQGQLWEISPRNKSVMSNMEHEKSYRFYVMLGLKYWEQ